MGSAGPGGAGQGGKWSAEDAREYARRLRALPVDQVLGDFLFSLLNAAQVKLGRRDARLLIDVAAVAHEHARPHLPGELTSQIDQVLGQLRDGSGQRGERCEPARPAGRERLGTGPGPAAGRSRPITPPACHAASLLYDLRTAREPPFWPASSHTSRAMWLVQIGALCVVGRGRRCSSDGSISGCSGPGVAVATRFTDFPWGLTACGQRPRLSHVPDAEAGALRCLTALGSPRLTWWMSAVASSRAGCVGPAGPISNWVRRQG